MHKGLYYFFKHTLYVFSISLHYSFIFVKLLNKANTQIIMKLLKGLFAIVFISMIAVSCKEEKKDTNTTKENVEVVTDANDKMVAHTCNENCKEENCPNHAKKAAHKCDDNCKEGSCPHKAKGSEHKCSDSKCSADCTEKDCSKCADKKAACKEKCAAKKA